MADKQPAALAAPLVAPLAAAGLAASGAAYFLHADLAALALAWALVAVFVCRALRRPAALRGEVARRTKELADVNAALQRQMLERAQMERALQHSHGLLDSVFENIPFMILVKRAEDLRIVRANRHSETVLGRDRDSLAGRTGHEILPAGPAAQLAALDRQVLHSRHPAALPELRLEMWAGQPRWLHVKAIPLFNPEGEVEHLLQLAEDITERETAERRVRQLNRTLTVLTQTNEAIFRIRDRKALLDRACAVLVEQGGFPLAWTYFAGAAGQAPGVFAARGVASEFAARAMALLASHPDRCPLPGLSGQEDAALICNTLECCRGELVEGARALGFASLAILPLRSGETCLGGLGLFGAETDLFGENETQLLRELGDDLAYALEAIGREERRKGAEQDLRLAAQVFENSQEGIMITDAENRILMVNRAFGSVTGYAPQEVIGKNPRILSSGQQDAAFYRELWASLRENGEWHGEVKNRRRNGELYPEWLTISVVKNEGGVTTNYVAVFTDITTRKRIEERLNFLAHYDVLTELPNRVLFVDRLEQSILKARHSGKRVGVLFIDLDRFKLVNESFGQSAGDLLLMEASRRLSACLRHTDSASRLGGDEFAVVLSEIDAAEEAAAVAQCMRAALARSFQFDGREAYTSASIGISVYPEDGQDSQSLAKNAEAAMYRAMDEGGNKYHFYRQEMNAQSSERMSMEAGLRHAVERGELVLHYQPLVEAASGRIVGAEALLRWHRPDRGLIPPAAFVPLLEETKLIIPVGEWILRTACEHNRQWRRATGSDLVVCVNFSAVQLAEPDVVERLGASLRELEFEPRYLDIELTESVLMHDAERAGTVLQALKALGLKLSIDDFGTGYSSLSYLRRFPFDTLKIDRSFVCDTPGETEATAIVRAIVAMGHSLGMKIIAEGVETLQQTRYLRSAGCDLLQGWAFSPALPHDEFLKLLQAPR